MELCLKMQRIGGDLLPVNYQYQVSSWIYRVIERADAGHSYFLHNEGFRVDGRSFKMFTFSQLDLRPYRLIGNYIQLLGNQVALTLRFLADDSLTHFVRGLFMHQQFTLISPRTSVHFEVVSVETLKMSSFKTVMQYRCLSPICISKLREDGTAEYLHPEDRQFGTLLISNLLRKARALQTACIEIPESSQPQFRLLNTPRKKGIHIKEGTSAHTQIIGYLFNFELLASPELHEVGYYAGFGEKNSMGFGCVSLLSL